MFDFLGTEAFWAVAVTIAVLCVFICIGVVLFLVKPLFEMLYDQPTHQRELLKIDHDSLSKEHANLLQQQFALQNQLNEWHREQLRDNERQLELFRDMLVSRLSYSDISAKVSQGVELALANEELESALAKTQPHQKNTKAQTNDLDEEWEQEP